MFWVALHLVRVLCGLVMSGIVAYVWHFEEAFGMLG